MMSYESIGMEFRRAQKEGFFPDKPGTAMQADPASLPSLFKIKWHRIILDEAHKISNASTQRSKSVHRLQSDVRWASTGTPYLNGLNDIGELLRWIGVEPYASFPSQWQEAITKPLKAKGFTGDTSGALTLRDSFYQTYFLRRLKNTVDMNGKLRLKSPRVKVDTIRFPLSAVDLECYQRYLRFYHDQKARGTPKSSKRIFFAIATKLRQICCDPSLLKNSSASPFKEMDEAHHRSIEPSMRSTGSAVDANPKLSTKMELCLKLILMRMREKPKEKILVFSSFPAVLKTLHEELSTTHDIASSLFTGAITSIEERNSILDRFQKPITEEESDRIADQMEEIPSVKVDNPSVLLLSMGVGSEGHTLTQASCVILMNPWWHGAQELHAIGRAHQIGQKRPVQVYKLVTSYTIEDCLITHQEKKFKEADSGYQGVFKPSSFKNLYKTKRGCSKLFGLDGTAASAKTCNLGDESESEDEYFNDSDSSVEDEFDDE
ncbi:hypothetical protein CBS101457_005571 [Exobasidium rhododendri]|nr:hypothetical protein CBS101457_005571 [Exobasidium rhododendri]